MLICAWHAMITLLTVFQWSVTLGHGVVYALSCFGALHNSQFKEALVYLILGFGTAPQFILCLKQEL